MTALYVVSSGQKLGDITPAQLEFLVAQLEEESSSDQDYYITADTLGYFASQGADPELLALLRNALGDQEGIDVRWA
jgi:processive 1,2-diacylglycerol beta-glucosyltransferase